jgi:hypothetical protein
MYVHDNPPNIEPSASALQALVQRLASADLDSALELSRLLAAAHQAGALAEQVIKGGRATVALAWLRRITREVDTLQAEWLKVHAPASPRFQRERRTDTPSVGRDPFVATMSASTQTGDTPETAPLQAGTFTTLHTPHHAHP